MSVVFIKGDGQQLSYWRANLQCSDGRFVCGQGVTAEEAEKAARRRQQTVEDYLKLPPRSRLSVLLQDDSWGSTIMEEAIRLIALIVLENPHAGTSQT